MNHNPSPTVGRLREELHSIVRQTLSLAAESRFRRSFAENGAVVASLEPRPKQAAHAATHHARLIRWRDAVESLMRRHAIRSADLHELVEQAETYVLLQCRTEVTTTEEHWRESLGRELTQVAVALEQLLDSCDGAILPLPPPRPSEIVDVYLQHVSPHVLVGVKTTAGQIRTRVEVPFTKYEQDLFIRDTCAPTGSDIAEEPLRAFGTRLFNVLFDAGRGHYINASARAEARGATLLLRLHLQEAGSLALAPWELLHDGNRFICLQRATALTRCTGSLSVRPAHDKRQPLRVLVTISTPRTLRWLDTARERRLLEAALAPLELLGLLRVDVAPDGTLDTLRRMLRNAEDAGAPYAVWHYIGHSVMDGDDNRSRLAFTAQDGGPHYAAGREIDVLLAGHTRPSLVVLNGCHTARAPSDDPTAIVTALGACGVPAIVAMQFAISDAAAITFAEETYGALAAGEDVLNAVTEARRAIFSRAHGCEWMTPVVFVGRNHTDTP
jgi:hypothetical protein